ncbi:MAG: phosphate signaling complex protein PhoU [Bacteroidota bacterium]
MNTQIQESLAEINDKLIRMSDQVIAAINDSVEVLVDQDLERAQQIREDDVQINSMRWEIEDDCIHLIATQQPVASDLRELIALLTINTELERIGDYAAGIAKITQLIGEEKHIKPLVDIPRMKDIAVGMIENSIQAFIKHDEKAARRIHAQDDDIDSLYNQVHRELLSFMLEKPGQISICTHLLWTAHNLERIGDRATNICERIIYLVSGEMAEDL